VKLAATIVLNKGKEEAEAAVKAELDSLNGPSIVNSNTEIMTYRDENEVEAHTEEDMIAQSILDLGLILMLFSRTSQPHVTPPHTHTA